MKALFIKKKKRVGGPSFITFGWGGRGITTWGVGAEGGLLQGCLLEEEDHFPTPPFPFELQRLGPPRQIGALLCWGSINHHHLGPPLDELELMTLEHPPFFLTSWRDNGLSIAQ